MTLIKPPRDRREIVEALRLKAAHAFVNRERPEYVLQLANMRDRAAAQIVLTEIANARKNLYR